VFSLCQCSQCPGCPAIISWILEVQMDSNLQQINKIPGVFGCFVCEEDGSVLMHALPPIYDKTIMQETGALLADGAVAINNAIGELGLLDLRYSNGRILIKPIQKRYLFLLCEQKINLQLLTISLNVAIKKLEKSIQNNPTAALSIPKANVPSAQTRSHELPKDGKGVVLVVDSMMVSANVWWDQMQDSTAVSKVLAEQLCQLFNTDSIKKIKLTNKKRHVSKVFPLVTFDRKDVPAFDNKIALTLAVSKSLLAEPGDEIVVEKPVARS
jgi:predicted regulator of Ras-like GTPase activity (Roadblock/LC7/MglB family)